VIPCVNPDGYEYNRSIAPGGGGLWRKNRRNNGNGTFGVDLNRNYPFQWGGAGSSGNTDSEIYRGPSPSSEPETTDMIQFIDSRSFQTSLTVHTFGDLWLAPWGYIAQFPPDWDELQELGDLAVELSGYPNGPAGILLGVAAGATDDYDYGAQDIYSWTPEIGNSSDGFWPLQSRIVPLAENNRIAFARTALGAGAWLRPESALVADAGDGDGSFEAGEDVSLTLLVRNSGRGTAAAGTISLTTTSPDAVVVDALSTVDAPSFTTGQNQSPLTLRIAAGTPAGTVVPYRLTVTDGPLEQSLDGTLVVGEIVIADFDFEAAGDEGWAVGAPNDASTGNWVRVDPVGTQAQPENDNTPGAGVRCWVTGQGAVGGGLGANDVDGGSTTLVSPVFDLSTATAATVSYARWYSNDAGAGPSADVFEVDVSNDGGATWTSAETVGPTGASGGWEDASIDLGALLALTDAMRVRFVASDLGAGSIVEAAVDDVRVAAIVDAGCPAPKIYCVGEPNAVGPGASIVAFGSQDTLNDDLTLSASGLLPSNFGLFFHGQGRIDSPLGNGRFCVGGSVVRMPIVQADGLGFATYAVDFAADAPFIDNGETWSFQYWYRDVGGDGYNFSDAVEVTFCAD
ncbi:MAG: M14 family zinc carboxypeptidase, partial [Planctomycetota bacterium]